MVAEQQNRQDADGFGMQPEIIPYETTQFTRQALLYLVRSDIIAEDNNLHGGAFANHNGGGNSAALAFDIKAGTRKPGQQHQQVLSAENFHPEQDLPSTGVGAQVVGEAGAAGSSNVSEQQNGKSASRPVVFSFAGTRGSAAEKAASSSHSPEKNAVTSEDQDAAMFLEMNEADVTNAQQLLGANAFEIMESSAVSPLTAGANGAPLPKDKKSPNKSASKGVKKRVGAARGGAAVETATAPAGGGYGDDIAPPRLQ